MLVAHAHPKWGRSVEPHGHRVVQKIETVWLGDTGNM